MPRISPAKSSPSPSSMKLTLSPSEGSQSTPKVSTSPRITAGAQSSSRIRARIVAEAVKAAQVLRPAWIINPGKSAPKNGNAAMIGK